MDAEGESSRSVFPIFCWEPWSVPGPAFCTFLVIKRSLYEEDVAYSFSWVGARDAEALKIGA